MERTPPMHQKASTLRSHVSRLLASSVVLAAIVSLAAFAADEPSAATDAVTVRAANLIYADGKTSVCFSEKFLVQARMDTHIPVDNRLTPVRLDSAELYDHPFAVMTGEGRFALTEEQREAMVRYVARGGFVLASAGCSSPQWDESFMTEIARTFPGRRLIKLGADHPVFHTVYDISSVRLKHGSSRLPDLRALEIDGRVVLIYSPDGLNDTADVGGNCCCCGGNEIKSAKRLNVNLLAYALTH